MHVIFRHKSPKTGEVEEKHLKFPPAVPYEKSSHIYTLVLQPANASFSLLIDGEVRRRATRRDVKRGEGRVREKTLLVLRPKGLAFLQVGAQQQRSNK